MKRFAPRIHDKKTGETFQVMSIIYFDPPDIYLVKDINTGEIVKDAEGNAIGYSYDRSLIGERGWRDIADVETLIPTGFYDENEEMIYVSSFDELHAMIIERR